MDRVNILYFNFSVYFKSRNLDFDIKIKDWLY